MINLENITKNIKGNMVVQDVNLKLSENDFVMLHGHNGSGKAMLLRLICGLIKPTSGEISREGNPSYGVIIENPSFFQNETAFYNLKYLATINKVIGNEEINEWLKTFNLYEHKDKKVKSFSLGMKQRLALVQAFMENPDVILLDEPFNGVDDDNLQVIYDILEKEKAKGKIIVIASHTKIPIDGLVTKSIRMGDGKITAIEDLV